MLLFLFVNMGFFGQFAQILIKNENFLKNAIICLT